MRGKRAVSANGRAVAKTASPPCTAEAADTQERPYPGLRALIRSDVGAWTDTYAGWDTVKPASLWTLPRLILVFAGMRATLIQRIAHELYRRRVPLLPTLLSALNVTLHGFEMSPYAEVGPRFYVPHPVGTVVVVERLGARVTLVSNVTIGRRKKPGFPTIGDDVYVGAGARILGALTVGDRVQIGANAVVITDVPSDSVAIGVPATIRPATSAQPADPAP
jgi:serine O-acetyltransferase